VNKQKRRDNPETGYRGVRGGSGMTTGRHEKEKKGAESRGLRREIQHA